MDDEEFENDILTNFIKGPITTTFILYHKII